MKIRVYRTRRKPMKDWEEKDCSWKTFTGTYKPISLWERFLLLFAKKTWHCDISDDDFSVSIQMARLGDRLYVIREKKIGVL